MSVSGMEAGRGRVKREVTPRGGGQLGSVVVVESARGHLEAHSVERRQLWIH